jgi:hypothetical protein
MIDAVFENVTQFKRTIVVLATQYGSTAIGDEQTTNCRLAKYFEASTARAEAGFTSLPSSSSLAASRTLDSTKTIKIETLDPRPCSRVIPSEPCGKDGDREG